MNSSKITIVTAIYFSCYTSRQGGRRYTFEYYENPFRNLLNLNANIVVFSYGNEIEKLKTFFKKHNFSNYFIIDYDLDTCPYSDTIYKLKEDAKIIDSNGLCANKQKHHNDRNTHLCLMKLSFLKRAIEIVKSDNYYWFDAGLFHHGIVPESVGGVEMLIKIDEQHFWPLNKTNICTPNLLTQLQSKLKSDNILIGLTTVNNVSWWNKIYSDSKNIHIIGGLFGGNVEFINRLHEQFSELIDQIFSKNILTLEEDVLSILVQKNKYDYLSFDTWYHDVPQDPCYYGIKSDAKSFYKVFI